MAVALASALAATGARLAGRPRGATPTERARHGARAISRRFRRSPDSTYACTCGARYRVSGTDRHRVYWPADAPEDAPVLGDRCVECEAPLPSGGATRSA